MDRKKVVVLTSSQAAKAFSFIYSKRKAFISVEMSGGRGTCRSSNQEHSRSVFFNKLSDIANIFKAFIGSNYLSLPFAFKQSGLILGIIGIIIIAYITDHCCVLIVKCKQAAIEQIIDSKFPSIYNHENSDQCRQVEEQRQNLRDKLELALTYGELGRLSLGKLGVYIVNSALIVTQFGVCVNYFIFMGDTITRMFPIADKNGTLAPNMSLGTLLKTNKHEHKGAPNYIFLMLVPFPFFMLQTYVRKMRNLGPLSAIANACVFLGFFALLGFVLKGINFGNIHKIDYWNFSTFPIFFGQLIGAYEGIGIIIPIETSMDKNRANFSKYLHGVIISVSCIHMIFGVFGYLHFAAGVDQLISDNLPYGTLSIVIQITLCIGVLFTYPLQMYPVIEIAENFLFKETQEQHTLTSSFNTEYNSSLVSNTGNVQYGASDDIDGDESSEEELISSHDNDAGHESNEEMTQLGAVVIGNYIYCCDMGWSTWKRNFVRSSLVVLSFALAYVGRDDYAYILSISGSIGSSLLAFVLPCLFHMIINKDILPAYIVAKDILVMLFGIVAGIVSFVITLIKII